MQIWVLNGPDDFCKGAESMAVHLREVLLWQMDTAVKNTPSVTFK